MIGITSIGTKVPATWAMGKLTVVAWHPIVAAANRFPPIGSYGFLSDCHTSALVSYDGSVEWLCLPRFDSPSAFGALLDRDAGHFKLKPKGVIVPIGRRYEPGTLVIETTWVTDTGWVVVHDLLSIGEWAAAARSGRPQAEHESDNSLPAGDDLPRRRGRDGDGVPAALRLRGRGGASGPVASSARRSRSARTAPSWR